MCLVSLSAWQFDCVRSSEFPQVWQWQVRQSRQGGDVLTDGVHIIHDGGSGRPHQGKYKPGQGRENILHRELIFRWLTAFKKVFTKEKFIKNDSTKMVNTSTLYRSCASIIFELSQLFS